MCWYGLHREKNMDLYLDVLGGALLREEQLAG
jgi:hypothetical protein